MPRLPFTLEREAAGSEARAGVFHTLHGAVQTPVFMPVGTQATVKGQTVETLKAAGSSVLLANTYHLLLRPGPEVFRKFGGIHRFMNWEGPVLTDSGGFQIFSLPEREMTEDGAAFKSYVDGATHLLSPESSIAMQKAIGSDIMMVLDQCIPSTATPEQAEAAMHLTHRWAERSLRARGDSPQALFGIVQGACHAELRKKSAAFLRRLPFDGLAIGGLAVGETREERQRITALATAELPRELPRYLMGVGTPIDILEAVHRGVDMFDCIIPTQLAQRGTAFTSHGRIHLRRIAYKFLDEPLDARCDCPTCRRHSRAYLHHLVKCDELLGWHLLATHNFTFYHRLMREMRDSILRGDFSGYYERKRPELLRDDEEHPCEPPKKTRRAGAAGRQLGDYEIVISPEGVSRIRQRSSGEAMHPASAPEEEARRLYVEQSALALRLCPPTPAIPAGARCGTGTDELVVWDVGLGAAWNAMAAVACFERSLAAAGSASSPRPLRILSFERDLDPLRLAVKTSSHFPHLHHAAPRRILERGRWSHASGGLHWELLAGDFLEQLEQATPPDLIFFDPFSAKADTALWQAEVFARIVRHCAGRPAELYTYSASTAVRVALLTAGFFVAEGAGTGPKLTTTVAFTRADGAAAHPATPRLLGADWLARWRRSSSQFPAALPEAERAAFARRLETHPQFALP